MKTKQFLIGLFIFFSLPVFAEHVSVEKAQTIANNLFQQLSSTTLKTQTSLTLLHAEQNALRASGPETFYYIFSGGEDGGFVIVAGDDRIKPVLAYAIEGTFDFSHLPPALSWWLQKYREEITRYTAKKAIADDKTKAKWMQIENNTSPDNRLYNSKRLLTANWDQDAPYNLFCPVIGNGQALTGCLPTAMAIIMHYHRWPEKGKGAHTYNTKTTGLKLSATFEDVAYNWNLMRHSYKHNDRDASAQAVAHLIFHCGVSMEADYGVSITTGSNYQFLSALVDHFNYDPEIKLISKNGGGYSYEEWYHFIQDEIDHNRPVYYTGRSMDPVGSHGFVCDGYNNGDVHINWGWGGYCNGYYALEALTATADNYIDKYNYSHLEYMITNIKKAVEINDSSKEFNLPPDFALQIKGSTLWINTPSAETITIYSLTGIPLLKVEKPAGESIHSIQTCTPANYIITGSSGWTTKYRIIP
ncbi:C10 family peptidase [Parabacteroides sp. PF5-9]|uniref:C10 family peptidase n=1 Tax=Parabacteroides sp. PF5-9 TaxID=1742404 RepID=UPI0024730ECC|nr:C10 family peptidase [Parabacteroides sp. PF5-9]MDH6356698.1 hypothetical protein [Parabacteroides sp. PF5-9]